MTPGGTLVKNRVTIIQTIINSQEHMNNYLIQFYAVEPAANLPLDDDFPDETFMITSVTLCP